MRLIRQISKCRPHSWNYEKWLPIVQGSLPEAHEAMTCKRCGRVLAVKDTSQVMRGAIAHSLASRIYDGDEYSEVYDSVVEYFGIWGAPRRG